MRSIADPSPGDDDESHAGQFGHSLEDRRDGLHTPDPLDVTAGSLFG
jgi:hypothetical protein